MKFSYNWIRELVDGLDIAPRDAGAADHDEDGRVRGRGRGRRAACARPAWRAWNRSSRSKAATTSRPWWRPSGTGHARRWSAALRICRPGLMTAYVPVGKKTIERRRERRHAGERRGTRHQSRPRGNYRTGAGASAWRLRAGSRSSRSITSRLTHRPDLWGHHGMAREVAAITRHGRCVDPVNSELLPAGRRRDPG